MIPHLFLMTTRFRSKHTPSTGVCGEVLGSQQRYGASLTTKRNEVAKPVTVRVNVLTRVGRTTLLAGSSPAITSQGYINEILGKVLYRFFG